MEEFSEEGKLILEAKGPLTKANADATNLKLIESLILSIFGVMTENDDLSAQIWDVVYKNSTRNEQNKLLTP